MLQLPSIPQLSKFSLSQPSSPLTAQREPEKKFFTFTIGFKANSDENQNRKVKVDEFLQNLKARLNKSQDQGPKIQKEKIKEKTDILYNSLDNIFSLYNMSIQIISQDQSDSAFKIEPVPHVSKTTHCLACIAVILNKFPYSFLKIIDINKFTICRQTYLKKNLHESFYTKRVMMNAIFMIDVHNTFERIEKHLFRVFLYCIQKKFPFLFTDWPSGILNIDIPYGARPKFLAKYPQLSFRKQNITIPMGRRGSSITSLNDKRQKVNSAEEEAIKNWELFEVFYRLMKFPNETLTASNDLLRYKAQFLKEKLEEVDEIGFCQEWWDDLPNQKRAVMERFQEDFTIEN